GVERGLLDQLGLLTGSARINPRHRSMNETLDWSNSLLDHPSRATLRRLAVLVAAFDVDTALSVAAFVAMSQEEVRAALAQLVDHNLLNATGALHQFEYRMLEPIRQYGSAAMVVEDRAAFDHHLEWCARSLAGLLEAEVFDGLDA